MLGFILRFLGGGILNKVLAHFQQDKSEKTEREKFKSQVVIESIKAEIASRQTQRDIILKEQGWWVTAFVRPAFAYPLAIYFAAVIADSLFHFTWNVDKLPEPIGSWAGAIILAYFGSRGVEKIARIFVNRR